tara:strand:+ start:593 stop:2116 length:1524 start_codon:yes stop_codon:yes gene_type:complete
MTSSVERAGRRLFLVLPGQCFPMQFVKPWLHCDFLLSEWGPNLLEDQHHQLKLVMLIRSLRAYADELRKAGANVIYHSLEDERCGTFSDQLSRAVKTASCSELVYFEIEDRSCATVVSDLATSLSLRQKALSSPMFLCSRESFADYLKQERRPRMASFYREQRRELGLLLNQDGKPLGGKWSLDAENRKALPKSLVPPAPNFSRPDKTTRDVMMFVKSRFSAAPGDAGDFSYPATRRQAEQWLTEFMVERLELFGDYEDALTTRSEVVYHSLVSPLLNVGLLTPADVIRRVIRRHQQSAIPLNSLEGFIRQVIGWREFIRGIYHHFGKEQASANFFGHGSQLTDHWYEGTTGIAPLDYVIKKTQRWGWAHHIERLMVVANLMNLCRIHPQSAYRWFMEMYVDSAHWVMGPNVFGMGLFSDGGIFATKPYLCGSSYLIKMGDFGRGDWCDTVDGLYWRFVQDHAEVLSRNHRTAMMPRNLDRLSGARREKIFPAAEAFLAAKTRPLLS